MHHLKAPLVWAWEEFTRLREQPRVDREKLSRLRWMIEEFRVSIFAQNLGTKQTVSEKRIKEWINSIDSAS